MRFSPARKRSASVNVGNDLTKDGMVSYHVGTVDDASGGLTRCLLESLNLFKTIGPRVINSWSMTGANSIKLRIRSVLPFRASGYGCA